MTLSTLIVDDEPLALDLMERYVERTPFLRLAGKCSGGAEALQVLAEQHIDVAFMDIQMPVMNGYEATRAIRALERPDAKTIPIIAMTANAFTEDIQAALEAGMNEHVAKPIDLKVLWETLNRLLGK